jgi:hypothetical protein
MPECCPKTFRGKTLRRSVVLGVVLFFVAVVLLEGNGYVIHHDLYEHGLRYSESWAGKDNLIKMALYQFVIFTVLIIHKSWRVWVFTEVFWCTCSQDLLFYLIWNGGVFPDGDWGWLPFCRVLGHWTTLNQAVFSVSRVIFAGFLLWLTREWERMTFRQRHQN